MKILAIVLWISFIAIASVDFHKTPTGQGAHEILLVHKNDTIHPRFSIITSSDFLVASTGVIVKNCVSTRMFLRTYVGSTGKPWSLANPATGDTVDIICADSIGTSCDSALFNAGINSDTTIDPTKLPQVCR